jgi:uridine kinase
MQNSTIIGVAGGSGSGKTTLIKRLVEGRFGEYISVLSHDSYYLPQQNGVQRVCDELNWDHPNSLDNKLFGEHIDLLSSGSSVDSPTYDFGLHARTDVVVTIKAKPIIILDGILLFAVPEIVSRIDLRVYVETPPDLRVIRRAIRDIESRGRDIYSIASQYEQFVRPMHDRFVEPSRLQSHLLIPWVKDNLMATRIIEAYIREAISGNGASWT